MIPRPTSLGSLLTYVMPGLKAHCPSSGAPLSDESVYPDQDGRRLRYSTSAWASRGRGRLTNGERVSSQQALHRLFLPNEVRLKSRRWDLNETR